MGYWDMGYWDMGYWNMGFWDMGYWDMGYSPRSIGQPTATNIFIAGLITVKCTFVRDDISFS
jgi:hypothetical protein